MAETPNPESWTLSFGGLAASVLSPERIAECRFLPPSCSSCPPLAFAPQTVEPLCSSRSPSLVSSALPLPFTHLALPAQFSTTVKKLLSVNPHLMQAAGQALLWPILSHPLLPSLPSHRHPPFCPSYQHALV